MKQEFNSEAPGKITNNIEPTGSSITRGPGGGITSGPCI